jgi:Cys-rich protein (TIGR01571 family)
MTNLQTQTWSTGMCDCFSDCETCVPSFFCPCVQFGNNAAVVGDNCPSCCLLYVLCSHFYLCCLVHAPVRGKIRARYNIKGDDGSDLLSTVCGCMSIAQEAREIKIRGPPPPMAMPGIVMTAVQPHPTAYAVIRPAPQPVVYAYATPLTPPAVYATPAVHVNTTPAPPPYSAQLTGAGTEGEVADDPYNADKQSSGETTSWPDTTKKSA